MTSGGSWPTSFRSAQDVSNVRSDGREPGSRRRKLAGYLKAANELRQTYQASWAMRDGSSDMPGAYPDAVAVGRSGDEEMVLFPSYARRHVKEKPRAVPGTIQQASGSGRDYRDTVGAGDAEYWRQQWEQYEEDNAIVDVDVRGWIYTPQKGPLNRKNRLFVGLARQLVGVPAPAGSPSASTATSRESSPVRGIRDKLRQQASHVEEELVAREAEKIAERGEAEAAAAGKGAYSEKPSDDPDKASLYSRSDSPASGAEPFRRGRLGRTATGSSASIYDAPNISPVKKRASWNTPAQMSQAELAVANTNLMTRLQPFMTTPAANMPISAFFYNDSVSRQKTIETDASGHFNLRASLDFLPTHVRVLASDTLSVTEKVLITEPRGISVISDIDDTIKHSAITSGAREIFRNVFIRDLGDLFIEGVKEWYQRLYQLGAKFHYVSNSPWQMFPVLTGYFTQAGLPPGSLHLKQYGGMFQGIFEPVAERKKGTLERIMRDFPERRFLLVGDSGEADLEVYTDVVLEHPGRVLGIFIRDVTTTPKKGFFDSAMGPLADGPGRRTQASKYDGQDDDPDFKAAIAASLREMELTSQLDGEGQRPSLPPRRKTEPPPPEEDLIDLNWEEPAQKPNAAPANGPDSVMAELQKLESAPAEPNRTKTIAEMGIKKKSPPPRPRKPSSAVAMKGAKAVPTEKPASTPASNSAAQKSDTSTPPPKPARPNDIAKIEPTQVSQSTQNTTQPQPQSQEQRPPLPARKPLTSYPSSAAQSAARYATSLYSTATTAYQNYNHANSSNTTNDTSGYFGGSSNGDDVAVPISKKEELWRRRWARAKAIMDEKGVVLRSWRVGADVVGDTVRLVEKALREAEEAKAVDGKGKEKGRE